MMMMMMIIIIIYHISACVQEDKTQYTVLQRVQKAFYIKHFPKTRSTTSEMKHADRQDFSTMGCRDA